MIYLQKISVVSFGWKMAPKYVLQIFPRFIITPQNCIVKAEEKKRKICIFYTKTIGKILRIRR